MRRVGATSWFVLTASCLVAVLAACDGRSGSNGGETAQAVGTTGTSPVPLPPPAQATGEGTPPPILITNARIFDGRSETLVEGQSVLVEGNTIARIASEIPLPEGGVAIDAGGRVMTPGFIGGHEHLIGQMPVQEAGINDTRYIGFVGAWTARSYLEHGWTTVRDVAGNTYGLKKAIDRGYLPGPRIYPSGPMISQTSGHADHRQASNASALMGGEPSIPMLYGDMVVADGPDTVLQAVRENLRRGSSQIKIAVGGGVLSTSDPLDVLEYTPEEIRAAVQAASDFGTYVMAHVYNSEGARRAVDNGVRSIEHANLLDEATLRYLMTRDVWISPQAILFSNEIPGLAPDNARRLAEASAGNRGLFEMLARIGYPHIAFGTDIVSDPALIERMNEEFVLRTEWFTPLEVLRQATSGNAELLAMSGRRNPYPGRLGVVEEGAYADLLLIDGNPLEDIRVLLDYEANLDLIVKDGRIVKHQID